MKKKKTAAQKRAGSTERKFLDRAILRLTRTFWEGQSEITAMEQRELLGLVQARRRVP